MWFEAEYKSQLMEPFERELNFNQKFSREFKKVGMRMLVLLQIISTVFLVCAFISLSFQFQV